jgi:peptide deformylase
MRKIIQYGNPKLETRSVEVPDITDPKVSKLIDEMLEVLEKEKDHSAGLSAPQVGENLRIAICRRLDIEESLENKNKKSAIWEVMINPVITKKSSQKSVRWEGCLSINYGDLFGEVERAKEVEVEYTDLEGKKKKLTARDYFAHVVQHEMDHLDGILFLRYIKDPSLLYTNEELDRE